MTTPAKSAKQPDTQRDWRYYLGLVLFVLSLILPLLALVIVPLLGVSPGISTVLYGLSVAGGPDLILIGAAALMGKENLEYLFSKLGNWFKNLVKWDQVTARRYRVGVWLLVISVLISFVLFYIFPESLRNGDQPGWSSTSRWARISCSLSVSSYWGPSSGARSGRCFNTTPALWLRI